MKALETLQRLLFRIHQRNDERYRARRQVIEEMMREHVQHHRFEHYHHWQSEHHHRRIAGKYRHFVHYHRRVKYFRPLIILFNLFLWFLIIRYTGIGTLGIVIAVLISIAGIYEIFFLKHLEKQVFNPIDKLKQGVEQIAKGNYQVQVECDVFNDLTLLVASFNEMARRLQESEKLKIQYETNRKTLIANISHDLKTPITAIQGYIEALSERTDLSEAEHRKYLQIIYNNTTYMNRLIDDLFLFSKLDLEKLELQLEILPVRRFMNDVMEEFRLELEDKGIRFDYSDRMTVDCRVKIDRKRVHQAIRNIIGNAVKYGAGQALVVGAVLERADDRIRIELYDNGPGIAADKLPFVFERFYRIDSERTKDELSTGLGLAIARELVEAHGGRIRAVSQLGRGSCFTIELPVYLEREATDEADLNH